MYAQVITFQDSATDLEDGISHVLDEATAALDLALQLVSLWFADLARLAWEAPELVRNSDRLEELAHDQGVEPQRLRQAIELVEETRQRFQLNVSEDLACVALAYRLEEALLS